MKFLIVLDSFNIGGSEMQSYILAVELRKKGHEVVFCALTIDGRLSRLLKAEGIPYRLLGVDLNYGKVNFLRVVFRLRKAIKAEKPEIILPYGYWPNVMTGQIWKFTSAKVCFWSQEDEIPFVNNSKERRALKNASVIIANSEGGKGHLMQAFGLSASQVDIVSNGVQLPEPKEAPAVWKQKLNKSEGELVVVMVANLQYRKDHATLIAAWRLVIDQMKAANETLPKLVLAGRFAGKHFELKAQAFDLNFTDEILFLGEVSDLGGLLNVCDLAVFSSLKEGCPNGLLEPMSVGLAAVAGRIDGTVEALGDDYPAFFQPKNAESCAKVLLEVLRSPDKRKMLGDRNRKRINDHFTTQQLVQRYLNLSGSK